MVLVHLHGKQEIQGSNSGQAIFFFSIYIYIYIFVIFVAVVFSYLFVS